jgi:hypothetical protein
MNSKTPEQERNEKVVRQLYHLAEAASKDTAKFMSLFAEGGRFYDISAGKKYYGADIGLTVDIYAAPFPICTGNSAISISTTMPSSLSYR